MICSCSFIYQTISVLSRDLSQHCYKLHKLNWIFLGPTTSELRYCIQIQLYQPIRQIMEVWSQSQDRKTSRKMPLSLSVV